MNPKDKIKLIDFGLTEAVSFDRNGIRQKIRY